MAGFGKIKSKKRFVFFIVLGSVLSVVFTVLICRADTADFIGHADAVDTTRGYMMQTRDVALNAVSLLLLVVLLVMEFAAFAPARRKLKDPGAGSCVLPETARLLTFLLFTVNCLQDSFISFHAMNTHNSMLPQAFGGSLPIVAEALSVAVFAALGGLALRKIKGKHLCFTGALVTMAGFVIAGLSPGYAPLLIGKILAGAGLGLCVVSLGAAAAGSAAASSTFAGITFGTISGIQTGIVAGSLIVKFIGYQNIFLLSAGLAGITGVVTLILFNPPKTQGSAALNTESEKKIKTKMRVFSFLFGTRAGAFLFFILAPAYVGACVIDYYMPLFSLSNGLSETNVGQISIIYGMFVLFIGPALTPWISKLGSLKAIIIAPLVLAAGMVLFALFPTVWAMIVLVLLYGVSLCFGYAYRSIFYASMPEVVKFGTDEAMGYFGMFENITQTFAPLLIASVMITGPALGAFTVASILLGGLVVFLVFFRGDKV